MRSLFLLLLCCYSYSLHAQEAYLPTEFPPMKGVRRIIQRNKTETWSPSDKDKHPEGWQVTATYWFDKQGNNTWSYHHSDPDTVKRQLVYDEGGRLITYKEFGHFVYPEDNDTALNGLWDGTALERETRYTYNSNNKVSSSTCYEEQEVSNSILYTYDIQGRLLQEAHVGISSVDYDASGRKITTTDTGYIRYTYKDSLVSSKSFFGGRLTSVMQTVISDKGNQEKTISKDAKGKLRSQHLKQFKNGKIVYEEYQDKEQMKVPSFSGGDSKFTYEYDEQNRLIRVTEKCAKWKCTFIREYSYN